MFFYSKKRNGFKSDTRGYLHILKEQEEGDHTGLEIIKQQEDRIHLHSKTFLCFNLDLTFKFAPFPNELIAIG